MKQILLLFFAFCFTPSVIAQNATLTKGETVAYLDKKMKEMNEFRYKNERYLNFSVEFDGTVLTLKYQIKNLDNNFTSYQIHKFNPLYINKFQHYNRDNQLPFILVSVKTSGIYSTTGSPYKYSPENNNHIPFYFLGSESDKSNGEKIKKALLHLQALLKAEDDPF